MKFDFYDFKRKINKIVHILFLYFEYPYTYDCKRKTKISIFNGLLCKNILDNM